MQPKGIAFALNEGIKDDSAEHPTEFQGISIIIEYPVGSERSWTNDKGEKGTTIMRHAYGRVPGTNGGDGDDVDVYLGPDLRAENVFIINQTKSDGSFDGPKVMLGFPSKSAAIIGYRAHYGFGWKVGSVATLTMPQFREWLKRGEMGKPIEANHWRPKGLATRLQTNSAVMAQAPRLVSKEPPQETPMGDMVASSGLSSREPNKPRKQKTRKDHPGKIYPQSPAAKSRKPGGSGMGGRTNQTPGLVPPYGAGKH